MYAIHGTITTENSANIGPTHRTRRDSSTRTLFSGSSAGATRSSSLRTRCSGFRSGSTPHPLARERRYAPKWRLAQGPLGAREAGGEGVAGGAVQVPGELHGPAGLVVGDALHGQQGGAAVLPQHPGLGGGGILGPHPLGGRVQPDAGRPEQLVQPVLLEHLDIELDQPGGQVVVHQGHRLPPPPPPPPPPP